MPAGALLWGKLDRLSDRNVLCLIVIVGINLEDGDLEARTANANVVLH
jgi:hypothetical protein